MSTLLKYKGNEGHFVKRNREIVEDRESGESWRTLIDKYGLSETRLRVIYNRDCKKFKKGKK